MKKVRREMEFAGLREEFGEMSVCGSVEMKEGTRMTLV